MKFWESKVDYKDYCIRAYQVFFKREYRLCGLNKIDDRRKHAQKAAIRKSSIMAIKKYPKIEPSNIWKTIYVAHVHSVSGIHEQAQIDKIISADNSWKKSSGHAFEEMIAELANLGLSQYGLSLVLQKDLNNLLKLNKVKNEVRDISWLKG